MTGRLLLLILTSVSMSALAQVAFKFGMQRSHSMVATADAGGLSQFIATVFSPWIITGFALYGGSAILWLSVLRRADLSLAYPFVSIGFVMTMLAGWLLFGENVGIMRVMGTLLVCGGVSLIALSR